MKCNQFFAISILRVFLFRGLFCFGVVLSAPNNRVNEAIFRTVKSIETDTKIIKPKVCDIQDKTIEILEIVEGLSVSDKAISIADLLCSKIDLIEGGATSIDVNVQTAIDVTISVIENIEPILSAVSESEAVLCSKIDTIPFGATSIDVNVSGLSASCDIVPALEAISQSEAVLCSKIDLIEGGATSIDVNVQTAIDVTISAIENIEPILSAVSESEAVLCSKIDGLSAPCAPDVISESTNLFTADMVYCVANAITDGPITISANNIVVDLNGYCIENGIVVASGVQQIIIKNGIVENNGTGNAILVNSGVQDIRIEEVTARNAEIGINFDGAVGGLIKNCEFTMNTTGLELNHCAKITIDNCVASCNTNAGYCLISSTTNCLLNCKSFSTGQGNEQKIDQTVFGFVSANGYGNIFDRCIANSTQALSTTDSNSLIAGFALRGTEGCTKIIDCESANTQTNENGVTVPYGILLEETVSTLQTVTGIFIPGSIDLTDMSWAPNAKHVLVTDEQRRVQIYAFDEVHSELRFLIEVNPLDAISIFHTSWSPDGRFIALAVGTVGEGRLEIYEFDSNLQTLTLFSSLVVPASITAIPTWSHDANFIAVAVDGDSLRVYRFDRNSGEFIFQDDTFVRPSQEVDDIDWSPDDKYLVYGSKGADVSANMVVYEFNRGNKSLNFLTFLTIESSVFTSQFSPDGRYILVAGTLVSPSTDDLQIYEFKPDEVIITDRLKLVASTNFVGTVATFARWSPDGKYIASASIETFVNLTIFEFDRGNLSIIPLATRALFSGLGAPIFYPSWSADGQYVIAADIDNAFIVQALDFPQKNIIKNNIVYCNSGNVYPGGFGISGSSIANLIIGNTTYSNPLNPFMVNTNYAFVTNVFNSLFSQIPTDLQNISLGGCEPIYIPEDTNLLVKQTKYKVCSVQSQLDVVESKVDVNTVFLLSLIDNLL